MVISYVLGYCHWYKHTKITSQTESNNLQLQPQPPQLLPQEPGRVLEPTQLNTPLNDTLRPELLPGEPLQEPGPVDVPTQLITPPNNYLPPQQLGHSYQAARLYEPRDEFNFMFQPTAYVKGYHFLLDLYLTWLIVDTFWHSRSQLATPLVFEDHDEDDDFYYYPPSRGQGGPYNQCTLNILSIPYR